SLKDTRLVMQSVSDHAAFRDWIGKQKSAVEITFKAKTEVGAGLGLLYVSDAILPPKAAAGNAEEFLESADWIRNLAYEFAIQLGVSNLAPDQIPLLEGGDIILLDRAEIALEKSGPKGKVHLKSSYLQRGAIRGSLSCDGKGSSTLTIDAE